MINYQSTKNIIFISITILYCVIYNNILWASADKEYETFTLKNGLEVYLIKNNSDIVNHVIIYNVGSINEDSDQQGLAHYLEHVMFLGSNRYSQKDFSNIIDSTATAYNAMTSYDYTMYYFSTLKTHLSDIIKIEADRMCWLTIDQSLVENEKQVIGQERSIRRNDVYGSFLENINRYLFTTTNYGRSVIGWEKSFQGFTKQDLKDFYTRYYKPNNAKLFISGNIKYDKTQDMVTQYYNSCKTLLAKEQKQKLLEEPLPGSIEIKLKNNKLQQDIIVKSYLVPSINSAKATLNKDATSLILWKKIFSMSSEYLYKDLVLNKKILRDISVEYDEYAKGDTSFSFFLIPALNVDKETVLQELTKSLLNISKKQLSTKDITYYVDKIHDDMLFAKEDDLSYILSIAVMVNSGISFDNAINYSNFLMSNLSDPKNMNKVINKYFLKNNGVVASINHE